MNSLRVGRISFKNDQYCTGDIKGSVT